jgi:hypothetical protein
MMRQNKKIEILNYLIEMRGLQQIYFSGEIKNQNKLNFGTKSVQGWTFNLIYVKH